MGLSERQQANSLSSHRRNCAPGVAVACRPEFSGACMNMSRPIWRKISAFKCWPAPRACRCLTSPAHSNSRKACPRMSIWCDVACGVCRSSWLRQICLFRKSRALPGFRIRAIARAGSGSRSASLRAATDGRCVRASPHGKPIAGASLPAVLIARLAIKTAARLAIFPAFPSTVLANYECHSICDKSPNRGTILTASLLPAG